MELSFCLVAACDFLLFFLLSEDRSAFPADVRLKLAKEGLAHLKNVAVCPTNGYMLEMTVVTCADPFRTGQDMEINAIASVVVGGTNINGGYPNIIGSICGAFLLQLITMMCNMNNITYSVALMIKAGIIVGALFFHGFRRK